jgi:hypothetical protein
MAEAERKNVEEEHSAVMAEGQLVICFGLCNLFPLSDPQQVVFFIHRSSATGELKFEVSPPADD